MENGQAVQCVYWIDQLIPAPYDRILAQLLAENAHAQHDHAHEAYRRQAFVQRVLNEFHMEARKYSGSRRAWRPRTLTPILARQFLGVDENYGPSVAAAVGQGNKNPTIAQATEFYLKMDLTNPRWILNFRRNLVHIPEARWHLGIVLGVNAIGGRRDYDRVQRNQDRLTMHFQALAKANGPPMPEPLNTDKSDNEPEPMNVDDFPPYSKAEVEVITSERLEVFFAEELDCVVSISFTHTEAQCADGHFPSPSCLRQL
jgi:hypothetical protein